MNEVVISYMVAAASVLTAIGVILRKFKRDPGQKEKDEALLKKEEANRAEAILDVATNTVELVSTALRAELARIQQQLAEERELRKQERIELAQQHAEQLLQEQKQAAQIKVAMAELHDEATSLRQALQDTQAECDKWRKKYEQEAAKNGGSS